MPTIEGYVDYQRREFCKDIHCPVQGLLDQTPETSENYTVLRGICKDHCLHSCHEFHAWLIARGYLVVRPG